jgi:hypothetical protein
MALLWSFHILLESVVGQTIAFCPAWSLRLLLTAWIATAPLAAATLEIHSEFLRVDPQGEILTIDRTPDPREIISPAVVRNGFASFHIVVRSDEPTSYFLLAGANPPDIFRMTIYKEDFVKRNGDWIPDTLLPFPPPHFGVIPDGLANIPGQTACAYLLDIWVPADAPITTVRLEVSLKVGIWVVLPLEVRVLPARVPASRTSSVRDLPAAEQRADESALEPLLRYMGPHGEGPRSASAAKNAAPPKLAPPRTVREVIRRNAEQDMALARTVDPKILVRALKEKQAASGSGGEWYLGIRDLIYRLSSRTADASSKSSE